jgi:hypothetical protein
MALKPFTLIPCLPVAEHHVANKYKDVKLRNVNFSKYLKCVKFLSKVESVIVLHLKQRLKESKKFN